MGCSCRGTDQPLTCTNLPCLLKNHAYTARSWLDLAWFVSILSLVRHVIYACLGRVCCTQPFAALAFFSHFLPCSVHTALLSESLQCVLLSPAETPAQLGWEAWLSLGHRPLHAFLHLLLPLALWQLSVCRVWHSSCRGYVSWFGTGGSSQHSCLSLAGLAGLLLPWGLPRCSWETAGERWWLCFIRKEFSCA